MENPLNIFLNKPSGSKKRAAAGLNERGQDRNFKLMSTFYITAIRYSANTPHITEVLVHSSLDANRLSKGKIMTRSQVVADLKYHTYMTATYNYTAAGWRAGAQVTTFTIGLTNYLRSEPDSTERDNLGNLLLIEEIR